MAKISKPILKLHKEALEILKKDELHFYDIEFVYENYHEGATNMNNLISAHFTPDSIALSMAHSTRHNNFVDLGAGIGKLAHKLLRFNAYDEHKMFGVCVENCTEFYEIGKKLLPQLHWINGDMFDEKVIDEIKDLMQGKNFSIISNPPFGNQVKHTSKLLKYTGAKFEFKVMELGAILGAYDGAFLVPQESATFRISGTEGRGETYKEEYKSKEYLKFNKQTDLKIIANSGFSTDIIEGEDWKEVNIVTEIAIIEYVEDVTGIRTYKPKYETHVKKPVKVIKLETEKLINYGEQISLF